MAIKKENESLTANSKKLPDKQGNRLINVRDNLKEKGEQKDYEAGVDSQDEQLNPVPEGRGESRGRMKPGGGNRLHSERIAKDAGNAGKHTKK